MTGKEPAVAFKIHDYFFLLWFWDRWVFNMWLFFELGLFILSILLSIRYILQQSSDEVQGNLPIFFIFYAGQANELNEIMMRAFISRSVQPLGMVIIDAIPPEMWFCLSLLLGRSLIQPFMPDAVFSIGQGTIVGIVLDN